MEKAVSYVAATSPPLFLLLCDLTMVSVVSAYDMAGLLQERMLD